jgi:hypothetical protein
LEEDAQGPLNYHQATFSVMPYSSSLKEPSELGQVLATCTLEESTSKPVPSHDLAQSLGSGKKLALVMSVNSSVCDVMYGAKYDITQHRSLFLV